MNRKTLKLIKDKCDLCLNSVKVKHIGLVPGSTNKDLRIELDLVDAGNCFDSRGLQELLNELQGLGVVGDNVLTMWFGFNNFQSVTDAKFKIWCSVGNK